MASAQVLRKKEHLEAGKRRLEEFRKKKAADRAKKATVTSQSHASDAIVDQKQNLEVEPGKLTEESGAGVSDGPGRTVESSDVAFNSDHAIDTSAKNEPSLLKDKDGNPPSTSDLKNSLADLVQVHNTHHDFRRYDASGYAKSMDGNQGEESVVMSNDFKTNVASQSVVPFVAPQSQENQGFDSSSSKVNQLRSTEFSSFLKFTSPSRESTSQLPAKYSMDSVLSNNNSRDSSLQVKQDIQTNGLLNSYFGGRNFSSSHGDFSSMYGTEKQTFESSVFGKDFSSSTNTVQQLSGTSEPNSRRSRPSFLDSLNVSKPSSRTSSQHTQQQESLMPNNLHSNGMSTQGSTTFQNQPMETDAAGKPTMPLSVNYGNGANLITPEENGLMRKHEFHSSKNEDFSDLEQHIEDLTQEKFSLQRALEASRALAESLAAENSSLTDNYNQQRSFVNQLKSDMENLQQEISAHLVELEAVKMEYANAKLECNAADERYKILASDIIGLEEKARRLRYNELKLERELENSQAELASYKKKISSLEKDRQDLQSTIDALQEEKKLLQSKLRKASAGGGKSIELDKNVSNKKDTSTSTEDLDINSDPSTQETEDAESLIGHDSRTTHTLPDNGLPNLGVSSVYIPSDQIRMIENINTLIFELALEKEELIKALASESSQCSRLKDINNELSRKLELQTQRLELLTAQSMVHEKDASKLPEARNSLENPAYADEGDEVVERVLGWIMKLFPGGPSKRRTSKLL